MAIITGTIRSDRLVGTEQDDILNALTGFSDEVDGAGGYDKLIVDYSALRPTSYSWITMDDALSGTIGFPLASDFVSFRRIEALDLRLDNGTNQFEFTALKPFNGKVVSVDGGLGIDSFKFDAPTFDNVSFKVDATGAVTQNLGLTLTNFEAFQLYVGGGINTITTGARSDIVSVGVGTSAIATGAHNDTIIVHGGQDIVDGGDDWDTLSIEMGGSIASYALVHDRLKATASIAGVVTAKNVEVVNAVLGSGADTITMNEGWNGAINSGAGADVFRLTRPRGMSIDGGAGIDFASVNLSGVYADRYSDLVADGLGGLQGRVGGNGVRNIEKLYLTLSKSDDFVSVDTAPLFTGTVLTMLGGEGNDRLTLQMSAGASAKVVWGADGSLKLGTGQFSGFEDFTLIGTSGSDILKGGIGNDRLFGGEGQDKLYASLGNDELHGGAGNDHYFVDIDTNPTSLIEEDGEGTDTVFASVGTFLFYNLEILRLTGADDISGAGNGLANMIVGNAGSNLLFGYTGRDNISGGDGHDTIFGGEDADALTGGNGFDTFYFEALQSSAERDTITDFGVGGDQMFLPHEVFTGLGDVEFPTRLPAAYFNAGTKAVTADHHVIYNKATGILYYDPDGVGGEAQIQIALLSNKPTLSASDFLL
ncbi:MAG: calcium-binding protein [Sphingobium sp.]